MRCDLTCVMGMDLDWGELALGNVGYLVLVEAGQRGGGFMFGYTHNEESE